MARPIGHIIIVSSTKYQFEPFLVGKRVSKVRNPCVYKYKVNDQQHSHKSLTPNIRKKGKCIPKGND